MVQMVKKSACNTGDLSLIPRWGRSPGKGNGYPLPYSSGFPGGSEGKEFACNAEDPDGITFRCFIYQLSKTSAI